MPFKTQSTIETIMIPAAVLPRGIGFAATDMGWIEVTSQCCSELVRFFEVGGLSYWRCSVCDLGVEELDHYKFPDGCRLRIEDLDPGSRFDVAKAEDWVARWAGCSVEDVKVTIA